MKDEGLTIPSVKEMYGKSRMAYLAEKIKEIMTTSYTVKQNVENLILPTFLPLLLGLPLHKFRLFS